ncbi:hypothetical protein DPMN_054267 [Dreissena polymorpha]|uniref:Uncharacterized protein n=1 Tax=Dreissena polymorpha TaxID=45954 RepID=A0A9D4CMU5_DREPO|nr:hypothetical protein DPMN_054267 [Dreissena polymorpha]
MEARPPCSPNKPQYNFEENCWDYTEVAHQVVRWSSGNTLVYHSRGSRFNSWPGHWKFQKRFRCFPPN